MSIKNIIDKTVYDIEPEDFEKLFCLRCKDEKGCSKSVAATAICRVSVDLGIWDRDFRKQGM